MPAQQPGQTAADARALHDAMFGGVAGIGTDEAKLFGVLAGRSPRALQDIRRVYEEHYHRDLAKDLTSELSGRELARATALLAGDPIQAQVEALRHATGGVFGADSREVLALLEAMPPEATRAVAERFAAQGEALDKVLARKLGGPSRDAALALLQGDRPRATAALVDEALTITGRAASVQEHLGRVPPHELEAVRQAYQARRGRPLEQDIATRLKGTDRDIALALATGDGPRLAAARLKHATEGKFFGLGKDGTAALAVLEGIAPPDRPAVLATYEKLYGASVHDDVARRFGGREGERLTRALAGALDDVERLQVAMKGWGADERAIHAVLQGRTAEDVARLKADFLARTGGTLEAALAAELSGRDLLEAELHLEGVPTTAEQVVAHARRRRDFERDGLLNGVSAFVLDRLSSSGKRLDESTRAAAAELERAQADGEVDGQEAARIAELAARSTTEVTTYVAHKDAAAQTVGVAAAVAATVATAGAGAPLLVTAAAGAGATVASKSLIHGQAYTLGAAGTDAVTGVVSGLSGAAASAVVGRAAATTVLGHVGKEAAKGAVTGFVQGLTTSAIDDDTWNRGLAEGLYSTGVAAGTSALTSAAMATATSMARALSQPLHHNKVVATRFPGEKTPVDLSTHEADAATRKAARELYREQGRLSENLDLARSTKAAHPQELKDLNLDEVIGLQTYTGDGYKTMNAGLRGARSKLAESAAVVKTAASGLKDMPTYTGTVYRGVELREEVLARYTAGTVVAERAFTSTTTSKALALGKTAEKSFAGNGLFVIKSHGGGKDVSMLSRYPKEKEILFGPGTEFKVLKNVFDTRLQKYLIYLEEVK